MKKRIFSFALVVCMLFSATMPVFAVNSVSGVGYDSLLDLDSGSFWSSRYSQTLERHIKIANLLNILDSEGFFSGIDASTVSDKYLNWLISTGGLGETSEDDLKSARINLNQRLNNGVPANLTYSFRNNSLVAQAIQELDKISLDLCVALGTDSRIYLTIEYDNTRNVYRLFDNTTQHWIADANGRFLCYKPLGDEGLDASDKWVQSSTLDNALADGTAQFHMTSKAALESMASALGSGVKVTTWHEYYVVANLSSGNSRSVPIRCDYAGNAYACWINDKYTATDKPQTITEVTTPDNDTELPTIDDNNDNLGFDLTGLFIGIPDGEFIIGDVFYDYSNKSYTFNSYTYNITNNYYTYNISYSWTYHINYTSVTYIGQSEEYDKSYEFYYQLPDGRSSADLTAEELEQLNLSVDVINYGRSTDDVRLRSLYHFDGNTDDSSFWNYATAFTWNTGASLTYMESGNFEGALYLDETEHDFTLTLPSGIGSGEFTLQWRMYQSHTEVPQLDSYVKLGDTTVLQFNGSQILDGSGTVLSDMPIGTWNELAIIRDSGTMRFYLNGVQIGSTGDTNSFNSFINFHFGSTQQTYKELDELRVLNYALVTGGANYTPTSVPHDTNLALVLPTESIPIADEYWEFSEPVTKAWDFSSGGDGGFDWSYNSGYNSVDYDTNCAYLNCSGSSGSTSIRVASGISRTAFGYVDVNYRNSGFNCLLSWSGRAYSYPDWYGESRTYFSGSNILSIVHADGLIDSIPFTTGSSFSLSFDWGYVNQYDGGGSSGFYGSTSQSTSSYWLQILPAVGSSIDVVCIDIRPANAEPFTATYHGSVSLLDSSSLNTPTLAVRSDIPVTNYQIGGVRPSIPYKGFVWAMVESGYITSLQIYDGRAWVACDGRIWTGERWIPYSSYNVVTLSDMYDIADASGNSGYEYIYSESGFWSWLQKFLLKFREDLFAILQGGVVGVPEHQHVYTPEVLKEATCTDSGLIQYTCTAGDHTYTTATEALEHDWVASEIVDDEYTFPDNVHCPNGREHAFSYSLDQEAGVFHVTCSDCGEVFDVDTEIVYGYTIYTCTRCGEQYKESNKDKSGLFEAIGDFIADGILWIVDKLTQLVEALNSISDIFNVFAESLEESAGGYPELFGEVLAVMPEDLMNIIWFAIVGVFAVAAWKKFFG